MRALICGLLVYRLELSYNRVLFDSVLFFACLQLLSLILFSLCVNVPVPSLLSLCWATFIFILCENRIVRKDYAFSSIFAILSVSLCLVHVRCVLANCKTRVNPWVLKINQLPPPPPSRITPTCDDHGVRGHNISVCLSLWLSRVTRLLMCVGSDDGYED